MTALVATDLDRTLIYSRRAMSLGDVSPPMTCVEVHAGRQAAFMTEACAHDLDELSRIATVVPVTTRIDSQYRRVTLPMPPPRYVVAANGGVLYVDGLPDRAWSAAIRRELAGQFPFSSVWDFVTHVCHPDWTVKIRNADGLFCYAVVHPGRLPAGFVDDVAGWASERGWRTSFQGRKLYWVPAALTKSAAVAEVARRAEARTVLAAGDSLLDVDLLLAADRGIHPAHGELFDRGWSAPTVVRTRQRGALAGEEIVTWFADQVSAR
ncbi:MAG: HAD family hydrolase [Jatrophihabitantaceae bacterium]